MEPFILLTATAIFLGLAGRVAWKQTRDPLHPAFWVGAICFLGMVVEPWHCLVHADIGEFFPDDQALLNAMYVQCLGVAALFVGLLAVRGPRFSGSEGYSLIDTRLADQQRSQLLRLAWTLGIAAVIAHWWSLVSVGGFYKAYSHAKGGGRLDFGYLSEACNLGLAATVLYSLARQRTSVSLVTLWPMLLFSSPPLMSGVLGGRRGPLFLGLSTLFFGYWLARGRLPSIRFVVVAATFCVAAMPVVYSQRQHMYLGSGQGFDMEKAVAVLAKENLTAGDNFVASSGAVIAHLDSNEFHFGRRYLITFFVRPIPKQIWPTKYDDMSELLYGSDIAYHDVLTSFGSQSWIEALGWRPVGGYAINSIADLFAEFSWGYVIPCWILGYGLGTLWRNSRVLGGLWFVHFMIAMALSVYLPTQSFSAFAHRFLFVSGITLVIASLFVTVRSRPAVCRRRARPYREWPSEKVDLTREP